MKNRDMPAMPITSEPYPATAIPTSSFAACGLTKREMFAMAAMQGLLSGTDGASDLFDSAPEWVRNVSEASVEFSDALLAELERTK